MATTLHIQILKARGIPPSILKGPGSFYCLMQCGDVVEATEDEPGPSPEWFGEDVSSFEVELDEDRAELLVITLLDDGGTEGEDDDEEVAEVEISLVAMPTGVQTKKWFRMSGLTDPPAREIEVLLSIFLEVEGGEAAPGPITSLSFLTEAGGERGLTPLMTAAISGLAMGVRAALEAGGDPLARMQGSGLTAVHFAVRSGSEEAVRALLQASPGVATLAAEPSGATPLHFAARKGHVGIVRLLVAAGASPAAADSKGCTPMHEAAAEGHADVAVALSEGGGAGACSASDRAGCSVLELATHGGHEGVARAVLGSEGIQGPELQGQIARALEIARAGNRPGIAALLEQQQTA